MIGSILLLNHYLFMRRLFFLVSFLVSLQLSAIDMDKASHLKGIYSLYMTVNTTLAMEIESTERLDLNEIMELQLRRGDIDLNTYVVNRPEVNVPLVELLIDTSSHLDSGEFEMVLRVHDFVTIDRNGEQAVAVVFEMKRRGGSNSGARQVEAIKAELRNLMGDFVTTFREANPK